MIKLVHLTSVLRARALLCGCAAILLSACGGNGGDAGAAGPVSQTAAELLDSKTVAAASFDPRNPAVAEAAAAAAIAGTSADETAGPSAADLAPAANPSEGNASGAAAAEPQRTPPTLVHSAAPPLPAASTNAAGAGAARIYVAGTPASGI